MDLEKHLKSLKEPYEDENRIKDAKDKISLFFGSKGWTGGGFTLNKREPKSIFYWAELEVRPLKNNEAQPLQKELTVGSLQQFIDLEYKMYQKRRNSSFILNELEIIKTALNEAETKYGKGKVLNLNDIDGALACISIINNSQAASPDKVLSSLKEILSVKKIKITLEKGSKPKDLKSSIFYFAKLDLEQFKKGQQKAPQLGR